MTCDTTSTFEDKMGMQQPFPGETCFDQKFLPAIWQNVQYEWPSLKPTIDPTLGDALPIRNGQKWLAEALSKLKTVSELPNDWDGYGSPATLAELHQNVLLFLYCLEIEDIPVPYICPISGGGIQIEWHFRGRELEVEFMEQDTIGYLKVFKDESMEEGVFHPDDYDAARQIIRWLASGK